MEKESHYWNSAVNMICKADSIEKVLYIVACFVQYFDFREEVEIIEVACRKINEINDKKNKGG